MRATPHPDSKHKIITVLVGFSREWPYERGKLRVLRSNDRNDYAFEYAPEFGRMLMFRVCDHSWHGFLPQKGQRMSLQLCYVDSEAYVQKEYLRHSVSAYAKSVPFLRKIIDIGRPAVCPGPNDEIPAGRFCRQVADDSFVRCARASGRTRRTRTWKLKEVIPIDLCTGILTLPICPAFSATPTGRVAPTTTASLHHPDLRANSRAARLCRTRCNGRRRRG